MTDATVDDKRVAAGPGAAIPPRFVAVGVAAEHDTPSQISLRLPSESATPSPEAAGRGADARRTAGPLLDLPALARFASSTPGRGKCRTMPPRGRRRLLTGALNSKS